MATRNTPTTSTLEEWRVEFNELATDVGNVTGSSQGDQLTTSATDIVGAINELETNFNAFVAGATTAADNISTGDGAVNITTSSGNITIDAAANNTDIIFKGTDATADITMLTLDGSEAGAATFNSAITGGGLLTTGGNIVIPDAGNIGSASDTNAIAIGSDGDVTLTQDLELQHDGAILSFGANDEVSLTHVHDTGILLNSTNVIQFNDASQNIGAPSATVLDINATDEIELNATLVDINANVEISGTAVTTGVHTFTAVPVFPNNTVETADIQADAITGAKIADDAINSEHYTDGSIDTAHIADNQVTLAKMAGGTDGNLITYDASGDPAYVATGSDGQVLTSTGAGSAPAFEALPSSGKIGQVVQVTKLDVFTTTSAHGTYVDITGMAAAITPSASSSKVLVIVHGATSPANNNYSIAVNLVRGSTSVFVAGSRGSSTRASDGGLCQANQATSVNISFLDSPNTTSATTYKLQMSIENGSTALFGGFNSSGASSNISIPGSITLMEVLA